MNKSEKVWRGIKAHTGQKKQCEKCPYDGCECLKGLVKDAESFVAELKATIPRERQRSNTHSNTRRTPTPTREAVEPLANNMSGSDNVAQFHRYANFPPIFQTLEPPRNRVTRCNDQSCASDLDRLIRKIRLAQRSFVTSYDARQPNVIRLSDEAYHTLMGSREMRITPGEDPQIFGMHVEHLMRFSPIDQTVFEITRSEGIERSSVGSGENMAPIEPRQVESAEPHT